MTTAQEKFAGGVAVITGAGAGIGSGIARRAGELGMTVVVTDVSTERAESVAEEIRAAGGQADAMTVDVAVPSELDRLASEVFAKHGHVRLLVNNAGIETIGYAWEIPVERWEATLNVNIHGVIHGVRAFVPHMIRTGQESWIANLASVGSFGVMPVQTAYILTKHAVQSFSECLYLEMELAGLPIHVSSIIPGSVRTSIFDADAGKNEPTSTARHRQVMHDMMKAHGMDLAEASRVILDQVADAKFWVSTQPEMTAGIIEDRIAFLRDQTPPGLNDSARQILEA